MTYHERRLARLIRLQERLWCPGYQYSEYAVYKVWHRTLRWAFLDLNVTTRDLGRSLIKEFSK